MPNSVGSLETDDSWKGWLAAGTDGIPVDSIYTLRPLDNRAHSKVAEAVPNPHDTHFGSQV